MRVSVTFRNMTATEALKEYARDKVARLQRYMRRPMDAHVILFKERFQHVAEIVLSGNGTALKGLAKDSDMYAAIDEAHDKIDRQVRKVKEKRRDHRAGEGRRVKGVVAAPPVPPERLEPEAPVIVRTEEFALRPLSPEEAAAEMEARGAPVLLFKNRQNKRVCVIYKRADGTYALVDRTGRAR
jgi:putative sigma-54 modulation protein